MNNENSNTKTNAIPNQSEIVALIKTVLEDKKTEEINILEIKNLATIFDYFIIATCTSSRQLWAAASDIEKKLAQVHVDAVIQGDPSSDWILVDVGDVIVHLFKPEARLFYNLDEVWSKK